MDRSRWAAPAVALLLALSACTSGAEEPAAGSGSRSEGDESGGTVLQPGRPGQPNRTVSPEDVDVDVDQANGQDVMFVQMMVPHHSQALEMSGLARERARDERVRSLARRIIGAQGPEIQTLQAWLGARDLDVPESMWQQGGHGHHDMEMAGMLTPEQMERLREARGVRFDRLFLRGMIQHHQGAVEMAREQSSGGSEQLALEMASEVGAGQAAEIERMREILADL